MKGESWKNSKNKLRQIYSIILHFKEDNNMSKGNNFVVQYNETMRDLFLDMKKTQKNLSYSGLTLLYY